MSTMTIRAIDAALWAHEVHRWGAGDAADFVRLVASGIDAAPTNVQLAAWRGWLARAAQ